ncbi:6-phosphogluconolactonase [Aeromicrobium sp. A1-2]|uniref:6-phosphogluconolactonase n=1 Tax=Aeromicrobium sp. A1-2 TaxID=2107713 RepID=UPI000E4E7114|nr:6-phosphogluconolactonase [Aeromicrobium sp. A1-2]AXT84860.1 6-phosphogluconolactonase [Aeromicrobium sp. A1-2]
MNIEVYPDAPSLAATIAERLSGRIALIQAQGRRPRIVLTGGTIAIDAYRLVESELVDWTQVDFYWGDERYVPAGHADRNDRQAREAFLDRLGVPAESVHAMPAHGCDVSTAEAADHYAAALPAEPFDLVLLGVGPDGHIASLFPGFAQLHESQRRAVQVFDSPKPPPVRISLTFPAINHSEAIWLIVAGEGKAEAVARALGDGTLEDTPASGAHGLTETTWLLDEAAASHLTR